jgi:hypothetical protein
MKQTRRHLTVWTLMALLLVSTLATGCDKPPGFLGANVSINLNVPAGLGGSPGFYNPFGIVQTIIDNLLGSAAATGTAGGTTGGGTGGADGGTVGGVL